MIRRRHTHLPNSLLAAAQARRFLRATLKSWALDGCEEKTELLVSELVTNAVVHGRAPITLSVVADLERIRIEVADQAPGKPVLRSAAEATDHGRGIFIVDQLADRWGSDPVVDDGKTVWCEVDFTAGAGEVDA